MTPITRKILRLNAGLFAVAAVLLGAPTAPAQTILMDPTTNNGSFETPGSIADGTNGLAIPGWNHPSGNTGFTIRSGDLHRSLHTDGNQSLNAAILAGWSSDLLTVAPVQVGQKVTMSVDVGWDQWINAGVPVASTYSLVAVNPNNTSITRQIMSFTVTPTDNGFGGPTPWETHTETTLISNEYDGWWTRVEVINGGNANNLTDNFIISTQQHTPTAPTTLGRGHSLLLENGLQIQAQVFPRQEDNGQVVGLDLTRWAESNYTTANFQWSTETQNYVGPSPGIPWAGWNDGYLEAGELPNLPSMVSIQYRDEKYLVGQDLIDAAAWLVNYRAAYPDVISFTNQYGSQMTSAEMRNYMEVATPDMLMFDDFDHYEFDGNATGAARSHTNLYGVMQKYRLLGLGGHDGTGENPIPYGMYLQTHQINSHVVSDSEMTLNQFAAWAFGFTFVSSLEYNQFSTQYPHGSSFGPILFTDAEQQNPTNRFAVQAQTNRQSRNLGPALVRLLSTDINVVLGQHKNGSNVTTNNPGPTGVGGWTSASDPYITDITATNIGNINDGLAGDVLVGYFTPLIESIDGPGYENEIYFMIVNALTDPSFGADTTQSIRIDFDFGVSGVTTLQRLSRNTGDVEIVNLVHDGGSLYHLDLVLGGGAGDLLKFNTGATFVPEPASVGLMMVGLVGFVMRRQERGTGK